MKHCNIGVDYRDKKGNLAYSLVNFDKPIAVIPSLAIHLDRDANERRSINAQTYLPAILTQEDAENPFNLKSMLLSYLVDNLGISEADKVLSFDLRFYDVSRLPGQIRS